MIPRVCPICCATSVEQTLRDTLLSAHVDGVAYPSSGAIAYRCKGGHLFLLISDRFKWAEPTLEGRGYSIVV